VKFTPETHSILDAGDAYASNISQDDQGRTILWLWGRTNTPAGRGWNGVMVMPRILSIGSDGFLRQEVPTEFTQLRGAMKMFQSGPIGESPIVLEGVRGDAVEVEAEFVGGENPGAFGFDVRRSASGNPTTTVTIQRGTLTVGNARAYVGNSERYKVRLFVDKRCLEVYVNDGAVALYSAVDAKSEDTGLAVFTRSNSVRLESLKAWPMAPASFNLDRFA